MKWLDHALTYKGTKEIKGRQHNPKILELWKAAHLPFDDDETPWCAGFVGGVLEQTGIRSTRSGMARSYLNWGKKLENPIVGCIAVLKRGKAPYGHVGFVTEIGAKQIKLLGGNQNDAVNEKWFNRSDVLGYRWPFTETIPNRKPTALSKIAGSGAVVAAGGAVEVGKQVNTSVDQTQASSIMEHLFEAGKIMVGQPYFWAGLGMFGLGLGIWYWRARDH